RSERAGRSTPARSRSVTRALIRPPEGGGTPRLPRDCPVCARRVYRAPPFRGFGVPAMTALWLIVLCGVLAVAYAVWSIRAVLAADAGSARMQEISAAVREGAQAYLKRQYTTVAMVGVVIFFIIAYFLGWSVAAGFMIGAILSGAAGFIGMNVSV